MCIGLQSPLITRVAEALFLGSWRRDTTAGQPKLRSVSCCWGSNLHAGQDLHAGVIVGWLFSPHRSRFRKGRTCACKFMLAVSLRLACLVPGPRKSDGTLRRQRCCSALGCASVPWRQACCHDQSSKRVLEEVGI